MENGLRIREILNSHNMKSRNHNRRTNSDGDSEGRQAGRRMLLTLNTAVYSGVVFLALPEKQMEPGILSKPTFL